MLTSPITTPHFQARVLSALSEHIKSLAGAERPQDVPAPIIAPLAPVDTPLTPGSTISQTIAYSSPWIDLCSPDPLIANVSRQVLNMEIAYASFCGIGNVVIPGPRTYSSNSADSNGLAQYARAIQEILEIATYMQIALHLPMYGNEEVKDLTGDLRELAKGGVSTVEAKEINLYETWDAWNVIRDLCRYNTRLSVGKIQNEFHFQKNPSSGLAHCD
jgi:protein arginine N-methyltransferase 5